MRWPWQRPTPAPPPASTSQPPPPAGWAFLPPLQRHVSDAPPSTLSTGFVASLPTRVVPSRLGTMGHLVHADAPGGTIAAVDAGLGSPVQRAVVADLTLRPPAWGSARAATPSVSRVADAASSAPHGIGTSPAAERSAPGGEPERSVALPAGSSHPLAEEPAAQDQESWTVPEAVDAAEPDETAPEEPGAPASETASGVLADRPTPASGLAPLPLQRETEGPGRAATQAPAPRVPSPSPSAPSAPATSGRRLGLGPPLRAGATEAGSTPVVQRADGTPASPAARTPSPAGDARSAGERQVRMPDSGAAARSAGAAPDAAATWSPISPDPLDTPRPLVEAAGALPLVNRPGVGSGGEFVESGVDDAEPPEVSAEEPSASAELGPEPSAPLIAQRALQPMLAAVTGAGPVARRSRAVAVVSDPPAVQRSEASPRPDAPATNPPGEPAGAAAGSAATPARGAVLGWIQRLVATGAPNAARHTPTVQPSAQTPAAAAPTSPSQASPSHSGAERPVAQRVQIRRASAGMPAHSTDVHALAEGAGEMHRLAESTPLAASDSLVASASPVTSAMPAMPPTPMASTPTRATVSRAVSRTAAGPAAPSIAPPPARPRAPLPVAVAVAAAGAEPVVQREAEASAAPAAAPEPIETSPATSATTSTAEPASSAVPEAMATAAATASAAGVAAAPDTTSPAAIETLAGQLYGPLVRRLKSELLLDRERRGLRIDGI